MKNLPVLLLCFFLPFIAEAKPLYVDAAVGDDSIEYESNSAQKPWKTIGRAAWGSTNRARPNKRQAAQAGDTVVVGEGTYTVGQMSGNRIDPAWNPANSGKSDKPIIFKADGKVVLRSTSSAAGGPIIGSLERSHIVWDGFFIDEENIRTLPDTGPVVIWDSHYITLQNLEVSGKTASWADNHNSIRLEAAHHVLVRGNKLYGNRTSRTSGNAAAVMLYLSDNIIIEDNEIFDSDAGIYLKGLNPGPLTVRSNLIHDVSRNGIHLVQVGIGDAPGAKIYQNVIKDAEIGIFFNPVPTRGSGYSAPYIANIYLVNNTLDRNDVGIFMRPRIEHYKNIVVTNNIISNSGMAINAEEVSELPGFQMSHNMYGGNRGFGKLAGRGISFNKWKSVLDLDIEGSGRNSPDFVDPKRNDYRLSKKSKGRNSGVDILNLAGKGQGKPINIGAFFE